MVTTERSIVEWLATYAQTLVETGRGAGPAEVCVCGWQPPADDDDQAADAAGRAHVDAARSDFVRRALARIAKRPVTGRPAPTSSPTSSATSSRV